MLVKRQDLCSNARRASQDHSFNKLSRYRPQATNPTTAHTSGETMLQTKQQFRCHITLGPHIQQTADTIQIVPPRINSSPPQLIGCSYVAANAKDDAACVSAPWSKWFPTSIGHIVPGRYLQLRTTPSSSTVNGITRDESVRGPLSRHNELRGQSLRVCEYRAKDPIHSRRGWRRRGVQVPAWHNGPNTCGEEMLHCAG